MDSQTFLISALLLLASFGPAIAETSSDIGATPDGGRWFVSPSGREVLFASNGDVVVDGITLAHCPSSTSLDIVLGTTLVSCGDGEIELVFVSGRVETFSTDADSATMTAGAFVMHRDLTDIGVSMAPFAVAQADAAAPDAATLQTGTDAHVRGAECPIAQGDYRFLLGEPGSVVFSYQAHTIWVVDQRLERHWVGDFETRAMGMNLTRVGDRYRFENENGVYTQDASGPIYFAPGPLLSALAYAAPVGAQHSDAFGVYSKTNPTTFVFEPHFQAPEFRVTEASCRSLVGQGETEQGAVADDILNIERIGQTVVVNVSSDVLFEFDSAEIGAEAEFALMRVATLLEEEAPSIVEVHGHTDSRGSGEYNLRLSLDRASGVARRLAEMTGLPDASFSVEGHGESDPIAINTFSGGSDNPDGRARNRRVEIIFVSAN